MKALSVRQPWAHFIAENLKPVETRSRPTTYRGPLAIHASLRDDYTGAARDAWIMFRRRRGLPFEDDEAAFRALPRGRVVAVADLVDCQPFTPDQARDAWTPWRPDAWGWRLRGVRRADTPFPVKGQLGIWSLPDGAVTLLAGGGEPAGPQEGKATAPAKNVEVAFHNHLLWNDYFDVFSPEPCPPNCPARKQSCTASDPCGQKDCWRCLRNSLACSEACLVFTTPGHTPDCPNYKGGREA